MPSKDGSSWRRPVEFGKSPGLLSGGLRGLRFPCRAEGARASVLCAIALAALVGSILPSLAATGEVPLVNADDEWAGYLEDAQRLIDEKSYDLAIDILQALIRREDSGFVALPGGQRYASLWTKANELVGRMGPAGLKLYRRLYDPQAQRVYEKGIQNGDAGLLRQVACQYLHTSFGPKALDAVGDIYFDRGRFLQAARCWRQAVQLCGDDADRALLTGKVAVAHHLAGDSPAAKKALEKVKRRHANAEACLAGQKQRIVDFIAHVRSMSAAITPERESPTGWPGIGGFAGGMAIMGQCLSSWA